MKTDLYTILLHAHSTGRWILMILLIVAIFNSLVAGGRPFIKSDARTGLLLTIFADIMFLLGAYLWYAGDWGLKQIQSIGFANVMKNDTVRFFAVEHLTAMLIAIILIHIGKTQGRKKISDNSKHRRTFWYYFIALLIILVSVPWPFLQTGTGRGWF